MAWEWAPTVADIAAMIRARTKNAFGAEEEGTFTETTRPTEEQVQLIIDKAANHVASRLGVTAERDICTEELKGAATDVVALRAAMRVELSYFPEQTGTDQSAYDRYKEQYDEDLAALMEGVSEQCGVSGGGESVGGKGTSPRAGFPAPSNTGTVRW